MSRDKSRRRGRPATTLEGRENQLISLASDLAERQLANGTASAQVITHFLKLGSTRERLEQQKIQKENLLLSAKVDDMASARRVEELMIDALNAMKTYTGQEVSSYEEDEYYED